MSRIRDITKFLGLTAAANPTNLPLASTGDALDSAEALALITGGNAITVTSGVVNHDDTSTQSSVNNSGSNFIQDITLDTYGHVTAITSAEAASGGGGLGDYGIVNSTGAAATASGTDAISIGEGATSIATDGIAIGRGVANNNVYGIAIGQSNGGNYTVTIGNSHTYNSNNNNSVSIGYQVDNPGQSSVAIGRQAGYLNQYASEESIFQGNQAGYQSGANYLGIFIGSSAGRRANYNNSGTYNNVGNIAIGYYAFGSAGSSSAGSQYTVAIGHEAGRNIHNSTDNIAIGRRAMGFSSNANNQLSLGHYNIAIGTNSGTYLWGPSLDNTLVGRGSGQNLGASNVKASWNTHIGTLAGYGSTSGEGNTFIGYNAGYGNTTGSYNGILGYNSQLANGANTGSFVIGYNLTGKGNSTTFVHGAAYMQNNQSSWYTTSDERIKTNVTDYTLGLDTLGQVNVKTYNYLSDSDIATAHPELADSDGLVHEGLNTEKTVVGIMAQELEAVLPNSVETRDNGIKSVNKDELFWVMLNSIKELKARVEALENA